MNCFISFCKGMSKVYKIAPSTSFVDVSGNILDVHKTTSIDFCRDDCSKREECIAFYWKDKERECTLLKRISPTKVEDGSWVYIKDGDSNYWWVWLILAILFLFVLFGYLCG